jgi:hypothetical protein
MDIHAVPAALRERLGREATAGLLQVLGESRKDCASDVINIVGDRFERRLVEETSKLRVEMAQGFAALRQEITAGDGALRREMTEGFAGLRQEMAAGNAALHKEIADQRFDILKWAFLFWVGQFFAVASLMAVLIRFLRTGG